MRTGGSFERLSGVLNNLVGLLIASLACIVIITIAVTGGTAPVLGSFDMRGLLIIGVLSGIVIFAAVSAYVFLKAARGAGQLERQTAGEVARLRKNLRAAETIIRAEPQILIFWEHGQGGRIVVNGLQSVGSIPSRHDEILNFATWLEPASAKELNENLDALFRHGRPFGLFLKTTGDDHIEADGRASGGRAIVKIRDVAGQRHELALISDRHRRLTRDIAANHALLDALPMPAWFRDPDGKINWANQSYVKTVEASDRDEVCARQIELLEIRQRKAVDEALGQGHDYRKRMHVIVAGERRAYDLTAFRLDGQSAAVAIDAAALESAEGELDRQLASHGRTLNRVATAVAIFGPDRRLNFFNEAYLRLWPLDAAWLAGHPRDGEVLDRLREMRQLPEEADYRAWKSRFLAGGTTTEEHEEWWHLPDGRTVHVIAEQRPDGSVTYLYDNVTERLALESRHNALVRVQRETLDHLKEGVALFASDGRLNLFNPAFASIWKLSPKDLLQEPHVDEIIKQCRILHEDGRAWMAVKRAVTAISDSRQTIEGQMARPDGSVIAYAGLPLPDGATLLTFVDMTDTKRVERVLTERNEALMASDRLKNDFISHISYELRSPLQNIIGFSELLASRRTGELNTKQREYLGDIHASSNTLQAIINDILDLATIDAGRFELNLSQIDVAEVVESAAAGVRERLKRARLKLDISIADDADCLIADEKRVRQVLYNLLSNAIGFSERGNRIALACRLEGGMISFTVADEGCGIPVAEQQNIFARFETRTQGSKHRGAGLGLSIVKSLVELHGGDVNLLSEPKVGTTVTVRFPQRGGSVRQIDRQKAADSDNRATKPQAAA